MIINNLDLPGVFAIPAEAYPEPVVDPDAPLAFSVTLQLFQAVAGRVPQVFDGACVVQRLQSPGRDPRDAAPSPAGPGQEDCLSFVIGEGLDHA